MAWRDFYLTTPPKSVTYVLNLLCIRCPEPAPLSFSSFRISICLLFQRIIVSGNAIPYGIQSSQLYGFGRREISADCTPQDTKRNTESNSDKNSGIHCNAN